jgi:hypothetical protein
VVVVSDTLLPQMARCQEWCPSLLCKWCPLVTHGHHATASLSDPSELRGYFLAARSAAVVLAVVCFGCGSLGFSSPRRRISGQTAPGVAGGGRWVAASRAAVLSLSCLPPLTPESLRGTTRVKDGGFGCAACASVLRTRTPNPARCNRENRP